MPYVARDGRGQITGVSRVETRECKEFLSNEHPEMRAFYEETGPSAMRDRLSASDSDMSRVTEDLIDVLIAKNIINFTDFPVQAQRKLVSRQQLRRNLSSLSNLVSDDDSIL